jgi:hypothetical protein
MKELKERTWTTHDEKLFLERIGRTCQQTGKSVVDFLRGYIEAGKKRTDWGNINGNECLFTAQQMLAKALALK